MVIEGQCHCGNLSFRLDIPIPPGDLQPRACDCSFCRAHGATCISHPNGKATVKVHNKAELSHYRFGLRTADFLVCRQCGVYIGAVIEQDGTSYATLNFRCTAYHAVPAVKASYDGESQVERVARRVARWTPVDVVSP
jgi:hypothetical protein